MRGFLFGIGIIALATCGPGGRHGGGDDNGSGGGDSGGNNGSGVGCTGLACSTSCMAADDNHSSVGCEYFAVDMDGANGPPYDACYAVFVANVSMSPVHVDVDYGGAAIDLSKYAKLPQGTGQHFMYGAFDPTAGLAPGAVAILFLDAPSSITDFGSVACPVPAAMGDGVQIHGTGIGTAFHITTDAPVVAYQELPYGGGAAAATGASLLIPSSAWQSNYIAVSAWDNTQSLPFGFNVGGPSHDIVAAVDNTVVTMRPHSKIAAGAGVPAGAANSNWQITLKRGQYVQLTQSDPLSGSPITSSAPGGVFGGHQIMGIDRCCGDHGEQMLTPVSALASEYIAAPHGPRPPGPDPRVIPIYGAVDGTQLTYEPANLGASSIGQGGMIEIRTSSPFVVKSQDSSHPFALITNMTGAGTDMTGSADYDPNFPCDFGDPDFVRIVPPPQYLNHYVFFTDPTYPFTTLTITRQKVNGAFADVTLDCLGTIPAGDWQDVGTSGTYQIAFEKLVDHWNKQSNCDNGVHVMDSTNAFGVWVWGWGSKDTNTGWVSYGYPAGEAVLPINNVVIQ